jgi:NAD(P)H-dependent FMN reductase
MSNITIAAIVGSLSKNSLNKRFYNALINQVPEGVKVNLVDISKLPVYNRDDDAEYPKEAIEFKAQLNSVDAFLFVTPEYLRVPPAALHNALEWASHPHGQSALAKKPAAVTGATMGNVGTFGAQTVLRQILATTNVRVMTAPELFFTAAGRMDEEGNITNDDTVTIIDNYWKAFVEWIELFKDKPNV